MTAVRSTRWKRLLAGAPSVVAIVMGASVFFVLHTRNQVQLVEWYRQQADASFDAADYKTALVCYARVSQARPADAAAAFSLFQSMEAAGQTDAAQSLLARLAPVDGRGYPPAEILMARRLLSASNPSPTMADAAVARLSQLAPSSRDDPATTALLAEAYADEGRWDDAARCAELSGSLREETYSRIAAIAARKHDELHAAQWRQQTGQ